MEEMPPPKKKIIKQSEKKKKMKIAGKNKQSWELNPNDIMKFKNRSQLKSFQWFKNSQPKFSQISKSLQTIQTSDQ